MNRNYVDKQWRQRYNQSIIENPIDKKSREEDFMMRERKILEEYQRKRYNSLLFPMNK